MLEYMVGSYKEYHKRETILLHFFFGWLKWYEKPYGMFLTQFEIREVVIPIESLHLFPKNIMIYRIDFLHKNIPCLIFVALVNTPSEGCLSVHAYSNLELRENKIESLLDLTWHSDFQPWLYKSSLEIS